MSRIPLFKTFMSPEAPAEVAKTMASGYVGCGPKVEEFEKVIGDYLGNPKVVAVNSATSGLQLVFHMLKNRAPDPSVNEILICPLTCSATALPLLPLGLKAKWVDVAEYTCLMDLDDAERKMGPNTLAILPVYWGGAPVELDQLKLLTQKFERLYGRHLYVVEDCAHAFGAEYNYKKIGSHGNISIFSFGPIKTLSCGDGGMIAFPCQEMADQAKLLRWYGIDRSLPAEQRCGSSIRDWGYRFTMNDIAATIGLANFKYFEANLHAHKSNASRIMHDFMNSPLGGRRYVSMIYNGYHQYSSQWIMTLYGHNDIAKTLDEAGIDTAKVHMRIDNHPCFSYARCSLPNLDRMERGRICVPCGWWLGEEGVDAVVQALITARC